MITVTKAYLPPYNEYEAILKRAWDKSWLTNHGELVIELEQKLKEYLDVQHFLFTCNGTVVLQMALKVLNITKEVITSPFSYVATTNAILWEGCTPVFVDIDPQTFCIDASKIEAAITPNTQAILATHVYGIPCNVEAIAAIAKKHQLKVIYDGAHAFGVQYNGKSLLSYGDISTCSFHATKVYHTVEGGCIIANDAEANQQLILYRSFGHIADEYYSVGINAKNSEFHAAMGLAVLPYVTEIIEARRAICNLYNALLPNALHALQYEMPGLKYNFAYYPILFESEAILLRVKNELQKNMINSRRYFYPSLNTLPFVTAAYACTISEDISQRVLCLPLYADLLETDVIAITNIINDSII